MEQHRYAFDESRDYRRAMVARMYLAKGLLLEEVQQIAALAEVVELPEGMHVFRKGERAEGLYMVLGGEVELLDRERDVNALLLPGDVFGELSLIARRPHDADAQCLSATSLLSLSTERFTAALQSQPRLAEIMLGNVVRRMSLRMGEQLLDYLPAL